MKKILLSLAAVGAIAAAAAPASAQPWNGYGGGYDRDHAAQEGYRDGRLTTAYVERLDWKITRAAREGRIGWDDARDLHRQVRQVRPLAWRVQSGEADRWETVRLERTIHRVERAVNTDGWRGRDDGWRR